MNEGDRAGMRGARIGFVFQAFHLLASRSVIDNVMLPMVYQSVGRKERRARATEALDRVGMGHRIDFEPGKLSGGERQRVAVARALVGRPSLLLADEPTGNLDQENASGVLDLFDELHRSGITIAVITLELDAEKVSGVELLDPSGSALLDIPVVAATTGLLETEGGRLLDGRMFDAGHDARADAVVVLGIKAASRLNINRVDARPSVFIGDNAFAVIGIVDDVNRRADLLESAIIPNGTAARYFDLAAPDQLDIRTAVGASQQVGAQAPIAVAPNSPATINAQVPPKPGRLGSAVQGDEGRACRPGLPWHWVAAIRFAPVQRSPT